MLEPKEQAVRIFKQYNGILSTVTNDEYGLIWMSLSARLVKLDIQGKIDLLSELNSTKLCKFDKEIDYWNEVLKEVENL